MDLKDTEIALIAEALAMAASRHESMGHVSRNEYRWRHFDKAERMRKLRTELLGLNIRPRSPVA